MSADKIPHWKNPNWKYVPALETDIRKTFERIRKEIRENNAKLRRS